MEENKKTKYEFKKIDGVTKAVKKEPKLKMSDVFEDYKDKKTKKKNNKKKK